ncbi:MAG: WD40 repeat protein [Crocinitomix sp.]|jgi:WD40 repeat protein
MKTAIFTLLFLLVSNGVPAQTDFPLETVLQKGHTDYIRAYDFSPDNKYIVTGGFDNIMLLWDVQSGKQIRTFSGHTERIRSVMFSPDQKTILSLAADNKVKIFEVETGRQVHSVGVSNGEIHKAYFSPTGKYFYALDNRDEIYIWDAITGSEVTVLKKDYGAHNEHAIIHPSEEKVLSVDGYAGALVISIETEDTLFSIPFDKVHSMSFSPNGEYIAISSRKLFASVFNSETGELINTFREGEEKCDGCNTKHVFSPNSKYLLTMSNDVPAILWDVKSGKKLKTFLAIDDRPDLLKFSFSGAYVLIVVDDDVYVYDAKTGAEKAHLTNENIDYLDINFSNDERYIAMPNSNGGIELWDLQKRKYGKTISGYLNHETSNGLSLSYNNWGQQSILNYIQHKRKVLLSPDNKHVMIAGVDTSAFLINLENGRVVKHFQGHSRSVIAFDFSADGKYVATAGGDRVINIWSLPEGEIVKTLRGHQETVFDLKFSADGQFIVSGSWDGTIRMWQWETGKSEYILMKENSPYCVGFTPNELYLVTGDLDQNFQFWERDAAAPFRTLVGHTSIPSGFDFSPNSKNMVTCSWDGHVKVWDLLTGMLIAKMDEHQGDVFAIKYDPNNRFIASGGADNQIILWDPISNKVVARLIGHSTSVTSIDITADGQNLISMSVDGLMKVWDLNTYKEVYSRIQMSKDEWLTTNPSGYFDGSSNALGWVNYVKGNQVVNVSSLFEKYYTPGLIERIHNKDAGLNDRSELLESQMNNLPELVVAIGSGGKRSIVIDSDSIFKANNATIPLEISIGKHDTPLDEIRIYNNGKLIVQESLEENITFRGGGPAKHLYEIQLSNGLNELTSIVVNSERTESQPTTVVVEYDGELAKTDLYILSIGINNYKNPAYNLDYAVNDSKAFVKSLKNGGDSLFNSVKTYSILNADATKANIMATITEIKSEIGSEDVFLFYYAGHGVMSVEIAPDQPEFFIVTHDVTNLYDASAVIREKAISAGELMEISKNISAEKQLFVLDACHSGGAIETFAVRGSEREKALAQLARNTGTFFLTAAQDAEYANEVGKLNHGLFTYALLEILQGAVKLDGDQKITVSELKSYVEERVPELSEEYHGSPQYPTGYSFGRDFPIVILK